jgi:DNA replication protein DnaC
MARETMDREELIVNLRKRTIDDTTYDRITGLYPVSPTCPTCDGKKSYFLDFQKFACDCEIQKSLQKHFFAANIGREYHDICLKDFEGDDASVVVDAVTKYLEDYEDNFHFGLGLTFTGPLGTGKTFAMTCVLKELIKQGRDVCMVTFEELINIWGQSYHNDESRRMLERQLKSVDVLGLDELRTDARNSGGFLANGLDSVLRHRTANLLPTLVTTNMLPEQEKNEFNKAYSLLAAKNTRVDTHGHDRRMQEVRQRNHELAKRHERRPIC